MMNLFFIEYEIILFIMMIAVCIEFNVVVRFVQYADMAELSGKREFAIRFENKQAVSKAAGKRKAGVK